jgi:hypothetical protein
LVLQKQGETVSQELPFRPIVADGFANINKVWTKALVPVAVAMIPSIVFALLPVDFYKQGVAGALGFGGTLIVMLAVSLVMTGLVYGLAANGSVPQEVRFRLFARQWLSMGWRHLISSTMVSLLLLFYTLLVLFLTLVFAAIIAYGRGHELTMDGMPAIMNELGSVGAGAVLLVAVLGALGGVWLYVRVSLSQVASVYGGEIRVLSIAYLTKGRVALLLLPLGSILALYGLGFLLTTLDRKSGGVTGLSKILLNIVYVFWTLFIQSPFSAGVFASIYQRLKPADKEQSDRPDSALGNSSNDGVFTD